MIPYSTTPFFGRLRWKNLLAIASIAAALPLFEAPAYAAPPASGIFRVYSYRPPVVVQSSDGQSVPPSRGMELLPEKSIFVGSAGGITLDTKFGSTVSIIGPALVSTAKSVDEFVFIIEYGDILVDAKEDSEVAVEVRGYRWVESGDGLKLAIESPVSGDLLRVRNRGIESLNFEGKEISPDQTLYASGGRQWLVRTEKNDAVTVEGRHYNNRHAQNLDSKVKVPYDPNSVERISGFIELFPTVGITRLQPVASTFDQNLGMVGVDGKLGFHSYLSLHSEATRLDYLYSPALRWGFGLGAASGGVRFQANQSLQKIRMISPYLFIGFGGHGASIDLLAEMPYIVTLSEKAFGLATFYALGLDLTYRVDLKFLTASETGLNLGFRLKRYAMAFRSATVATGYGLSNKNWTYLNLAPVVSLSMRF